MSAQSIRISARGRGMFVLSAASADSFRRAGRAALYDERMLIVQVHVRVKPEFVDAFRQATLANARASIQEPGIARFDVLVDNSDPAHFVLVEVYRTPEDPARHRETAHYALWRDTAEPMMAEPRSRAMYQNVFPGDEGW